MSKTDQVRIWAVVVSLTTETIVDVDTYDRIAVVYRLEYEAVRLSSQLVLRSDDEAAAMDEEHHRQLGAR